MERLEIGYMCRHGHFQFNGDPDGDACGTKGVGKIYVEALPDVESAELLGCVDDSLTRLHEQVEFWRHHSE